MKLTYAHIRAFNAVARLGSFSSAAVDLGVTQPAISLQIRALEDVYSVVLFVRSRETAALTPLGQEMYALTQSIHLIETEVDTLLSRQSDLIDGTLSIAAGSPQLIMPLIQKFHSAYPGVHISLQLGNYQTLFSKVLENKVDVALLDGPISHDRLHSTLFLQQELVLVTGKDHPLSAQSMVRPDDVVKETILTRGDGSFTQEIMENWMAEARVVADKTMQFSTRDAILEAVAAGIGIGFVFEKEVGSDPRIVTTRLGGRSTRSKESLVCLKSQFRRRTIKALFDLLPQQN